MAGWLLSSKRQLVSQNNKMTLGSQLSRTWLRKESGFTLIDVTIGVGMSVVMFVTLYLGIAQGFGIIQLARENLRATQIMQEKTETIWLYTWDQITTPGFIPPTFTASFYPTGQQGNQGITYQGTVRIANAPVTESYADSLKMVTVALTWQSGTVTRQREMNLILSRYGLHNYIY